MPGPEFLDGERLTLRLVDPTDYEFIASNWMRTRRQTAIMTTPLTTADIADWVEKGDSIHVLPCQDDTPVGHVFVQSLDWEARKAELGYMIIPEEQGNGYATEATGRCVTYGFDELGLHKLWARVQGDNDGSKRVLTKLGFQPEGVLRDWHYAHGDYVDEYRFGYLRTER